MSVLVTGGAGYIGSHTVEMLKDIGEHFVVVDNFSTGHKKALQNLSVDYIECDVRDKESLSEVFSMHDIDTVMHFASYSIVSESMTNPSKYYNNNVTGMITLLDIMNEHDVKNIIFASTAAVYGIANKELITESMTTNPINPYGSTKLVMEDLIKWYAKSYGIRFVIFRFFNAAGASESKRIGEAHINETHLIPIVLSVALKKREVINVFGNDYETVDGTCVRDYVHVVDIAQAHINAMNYLRNAGNSCILNLGNGVGFSVNEIIDSCRNITKETIRAKIVERRVGDPDTLVADGSCARKTIGWKPTLSSIDQIVESAWKWHKENPNGFLSTP